MWSPVSRFMMAVMSVAISFSWFLDSHSRLRTLVESETGMVKLKTLVFSTISGKILEILKRILDASTQSTKGRVSPEKTLSVFFFFFLGSSSSSLSLSSPRRSIVWLQYWRWRPVQNFELAILVSLAPLTGVSRQLASAGAGTHSTNLKNKHHVSDMGSALINKCQGKKSNCVLWFINISMSNVCNKL